MSPVWLCVLEMSVGLWWIVGYAATLLSLAYKDIAPGESSDGLEFLAYFVGLLILWPIVGVFYIMHYWFGKGR